MFKNNTKKANKAIKRAKGTVVVYKRGSNTIDDTKFYKSSSRLWIVL